MTDTTGSNGNDSESLLAVEVLIWQLLRNGTLKAEPLATQLERYAGFLKGGGDRLRALAQMVRHGGWSTEQEELRRKVDPVEP